MYSRFSTAIAMAARQRTLTVQASRTFIAPSMPLAKDSVQELFLNELRSYKPSSTAKDSEISPVKSLKIPAAPAVPNVDANITAAISDYARDDATVAAADKSTSDVHAVEYMFAPEPESETQAH